MKIIDTQGRDVLTPSPVVEQTGRVLISRVPNSGSWVGPITSDKAYFVYLGRTTQSIVAKYVEFYVHAAGTNTGQQNAEVGLFSTSNAPNKTTQGNNGIAKLTASGILDSLTSTGVKRNTTAFNSGAGYTVPAGTYLWAGLRSALTTTQPTLAGLGQDFGEGMVLSTTPPTGALTNAGPWTGAIIPITTYYYSAICPDLRINLD